MDRVRHRIPRDGVASRRGPGPRHRARAGPAREWGARDFNEMLRRAAFGGHAALCEQAREWGATDLDGMLRMAQLSGEKAIRELAAKWKLERRH